MSVIQLSQPVQRGNFLTRWIRDRTGSDGVELLDPEVYPTRELEYDERSINMRLDTLAVEIREEEETANEAARLAAEADSDAIERMRKQDAKHALKTRDRLDDKADRLIKKRGLLLSIQHARDALNGGALDLTLDEVLDGEDTDELGSKIRDVLVDLGMNDDDIVQITRTLDVNLPNGDAESEYSDAVDRQVERLKSEEISDDEFDLADVQRQQNASGHTDSQIRDRRERQRDPRDRDRN